MKSRPRYVLLALALLMAGSAYGEVSTPLGSLRVGAAAKWVYGFSARDDDTLSPGMESMATTLVDVTLRGVLTEHLSYDLELSANWNRDTAAGSIAGPANPAELGTAGVRQARINLVNLIPWTTVGLGTFIPPLTNYMPRAVTNLDLIQYPLLNNATRMNTGLFGNRPAARDFSTWQQAGVNFHIEPPYMITLDLGMWNGMMPVNVSNTNQNKAMATSIVATFKPRDYLSLSLAFWGEEFQQAYPGLAKGAKRNLTMWLLSAAYTNDVMEVTADYCQGLIPLFILDTHGDFQDVTWDGWQVTFGYWVLPTVEAMIRHEYFDPNSKDSVQVPAGKYDESYWTTIGINWRVAEQAELAVNYVFKNETGRFIREGDLGEDPNLPGYNPKWGAQKNDLLLVQFMIWQ